MRLVPLGFVVLAACRAGIAPGVTHRAHDGEVVSSVQGELGGYVPRSGVGGFVSITSADTVGENESHAGWMWWLLEARYRRVLRRYETSSAYWAAGAAFGDGSRGVVGGTHAEVGFVVPSRYVSFDISLRHRFLVVADGELTRPMNSLQVAFTFGGRVDR